MRAHTIIVFVRLLILLSLVHPLIRVHAADFSVGSYNLELYLDRPYYQVTTVKSDEAKKKIRQTLKLLNADVVALQEIGSTELLQELQSALRAEGLNYKYAEFMPAPDDRLNLAFLSRLPILARHRFTNEVYLLRSKKRAVERGFSAIEVHPAGGPRCTILNAHLKSKRQIFEALEAEVRENEAILLHRRVEKLRSSSKGNLIVLGDFNDSVESRTLQILLGRGEKTLYDVRPAERNGDSGFRSDPVFNTREIVWTHYFGRDESFTRLDYILVTRNLFSKLDRPGTFIVTVPDWGIASDHRAIKAAFSF